MDNSHNQHSIENPQARPRSISHRQLGIEAPLGGRATDVLILVGMEDRRARLLVASVTAVECHPRQLVPAIPPHAPVFRRQVRWARPGLTGCELHIRSAPSHRGAFVPSCHTCQNDATGGPSLPLMTWCGGRWSRVRVGRGRRFSQLSLWSSRPSAVGLRQRMHRPLCHEDSGGTNLESCNDRFS